MSIILKGIDLPEKENRMYMMELYADGHCSVAKIENGKCYELTIPSETEAIQIPTPHGRLIDASELDKCWEEKEDISEDVDYKILYKCVLAISKYAPTMLESEE